MSAFDDLKTWSFHGVYFARQIQGTDWQVWFELETVHQVDVVLGSGERYVDIGGGQISPLQLRAVTQSKADRDALVQCVEDLTQATLSNGKGRTTRALAVRGIAIDMGGTGLYAADITFIKLDD